MRNVIWVTAVRGMAMILFASLLRKSKMTRTVGPEVFTHPTDIL